MRISAPPLAVLGCTASATYTSAVLRRMESEYARTDTLRPSTVVMLYSAYAATGVAVAGAVHAGAWPLPVPRSPAFVAGTALAGAGAFVAVLGMSRFASAAQLSGTQAGQFHRSGLYRHTRNPQYLGLAGLLVGTPFAARSIPGLALGVFSVGVLDRWIRSEETHLSRAFGTDYHDYLTDVPRWL